MSGWYRRILIDATSLSNIWRIERFHSFPVHVVMAQDTEYYSAVTAHPDVGKSHSFSSFLCKSLMKWKILQVQILGHD